MVSFENSIRINQPVEKVFAFLSEFENVPKWNYYVVDVRKTSESPLGVGTTYHQTRKTDSQDLRIVDFDKNKTVSIETIPPSKPELSRKMIFSEENGTTLLVDHWTLDTGHPGFLQKLATRRVKSAVRDNLLKLKELLETGRTALQDGRQISI